MEINLLKLDWREAVCYTPLGKYKTGTNDRVDCALDGVLLMECGAKLVQYK